MPVLVTTADSALGGLVVRRILREGGEVRAFGSPSGDLGLLRAAGAIVATGDPDDEGRLEAALADVHTVVHPVTGLLARDVDDVLVAANVMVKAAVAAGVRRIVTLSIPGAAVDADDALRQAHGRLEAILRAAPLPTVVVRTGLTDSPGMRDALASLPLPESLAEHPVYPLRTDDLVEVLAALDAVRSSAREGHAVLHALGPEPLTVARYLERAGVTGGDLVGRVYTPADRVPLLLGALGGPWEPGPDAADLWTLLGRQARPIAP